MNFLFFKKLPDIARDTKEKVTQAFIKLKADDSNFFYKENLNLIVEISETGTEEEMVSMKSWLTTRDFYKKGGPF